MTGSPSRAYYCDSPDAGDAQDLQRLHALAMPGAVSLSLRTDPDVRQAAAVQGDRWKSVVVRRRMDDRVVAVGMRSVRGLWVNGIVQRIGYLHGLRNTPGVRLPRRLIVEAYERLMSNRLPDETDYDLTSIMADNHTARRALERGFAGLPRYTPLGEVVTVTLPVSRPRALKPPLRQLKDCDLSAVELLLQRYGMRAHARPSWTRELLGCSESCRGLRGDSFIGYEEGGDLVACGAVWDQRAFKQTVIAGLSPTLDRWRGVINAGCRCIGRVGLPGAGATLPMVYVSHLAVPGDRPDILHHLLNGLRSLAAQKNARVVVLGLPASVFRMISLSLRCKAWQTRSVMYAVHHGAPPELDNRPVWPEIAVL